MSEGTDGFLPVEWTPEEEKDARMICEMKGDDPERQVDCCGPDGEKFGSIPAWTVFLAAAKAIPRFPASEIN